MLQLKAYLVDIVVPLSLMTSESACDQNQTQPSTSSSPDMAPLREDLGDKRPLVTSRSTHELHLTHVGVRLTFSLKLIKQCLEVFRLRVLIGCLSVLVPVR